jgi:hypothetical protein
MLDRELVTKHTGLVREVLKLRRADHLLDGFEETNSQRKATITLTETLRARKNVISDEIPKLKKAKEPADHLIAESKTIGVQIAELEKELKRLESVIDTVLQTLPNLPQGHLERVIVESMPEEERRYFRLLHQLALAEGAVLDGASFHLPQEVLNNVLGLLLSEEETTTYRTLLQQMQESQDEYDAAMERIRLLDAEFARIDSDFHIEEGVDSGHDNSHETTQTAPAD